MKKFFQKAVMVFLFCFLSIYFTACSNNEYKYDYIKLTNVKESVENYKFSFTVENISDGDITVYVRVFLKPGGVTNSDGKKIAKGDNYTFYCNSARGDFFENPKGLIAVYDENGQGVETVSFEFKV